MLVGSFFFAGSETALTSLGEAKARQLRDRLGRRGSILALWIHRPKEVLTCLLIGNNLVNIGASALATNISLTIFGSGALAIATGVMTLVVLVFGEITPKTLAREHSERVAVPILQILRPFFLLSYPFVYLLSRFTDVVGKRFGAEGKAPVTSEDIDYLIDLGSRFGALKGVKRELLISVLEFSELLVREIMRSRTQVVSLEASSKYEDVMDRIDEFEHSRIPVTEQGIDNVVGILYVKDLLAVLGRGEVRPAEFDLRSYLRPAFFVPDVMKVSRLLKEMQRRQTHLAVVVDEFGGTSGIVTLEDVVEEIVGDIKDEHDIEARPVKVLPDGKVIVDAMVPLRDLEEVLHIDFPHEGDYETIGGFLTASAGRVPPEGSLVSYGGLAFLVSASDEKRVLKVEISRRPEIPESERRSDRDGGPPEGRKTAGGNSDDEPAAQSNDGGANSEGVSSGDEAERAEDDGEPRFFLGSST